VTGIVILKFVRISRFGKNRKLSLPVFTHNILIQPHEVVTSANDAIRISKVMKTA